MDLNGRSALVTGGAGGLGGATVRRLAALGVGVAFFDRDADRAAELAKELGDGAVAVGGDVNDDDDDERAATVAAYMRGHGVELLPPGVRSRPRKVAGRPMWLRAGEDPILDSSRARGIATSARRRRDDLTPEAARALVAEHGSLRAAAESSCYSRAAIRRAARE
jgi:hypothetical protein